MATPLPSSSVAKIKILLTTIKAKLDKDEESSSNKEEKNNDKHLFVSSFSEGVTMLLELELVQRGEIQTTPATTTTKTLISVLERVLSAAGKVLLTSPPPLLAGASVLQARVAEKLLLLLIATNTTATTNANTAATVLLDAPLLEMARKVVDRCQQVQDERFQAITSSLLLLLPHSTSDTANITLMMESWLSYMAEGCFYRAASLVDNPPMWKGAWDVIVRRRRRRRRRNNANAATNKKRSASSTSATWEAAHALENLHRIAAAKGNAKRQAEVSLALVECLLAEDDYDYNDTRNTSPSNTATPSLSLVIHAFVEPYRSTQPQPRTLALETICARHLQQLESSSSSLEDGSTSSMVSLLLLKILQLRWCLAVRANKIWQAAVAMHEAAKNRVKEEGNTRSGSGSTTSSRLVLSLDKFVDQARRDYFYEDDDELDARAQQLLKEVLLLASSSIAPTTGSAAAAGEDDGEDDDTCYYHYWKACQCLVTDYLVSWQMDRAKAKAQKILSVAAKARSDDDATAATVELLLHEWRIGSDMVSRLLTQWEQSGVIVINSTSANNNSPHNGFMLTNDLTAEKSGLVQQAVLLVPFIEWMSSSLVVMTQKSTTSLFSISHLRLARDLLQQYQQQQQWQTAALAASTALSSSLSASAHSKEWKRLNMAYRSARALVYLSETTTGSDDDSIIRDASSSSGDDDDNYESNADCEFGTAMLEFAIVWSGLHRIPWSHCVASADARVLVRKARSCVAAAASEWGRQSCSAEQWILNLGQADAEVASPSLAAATGGNGSLLTEAQKLYSQVLETIADSTVMLDQTLGVILQSKCYSGLVGLSIRCSSSTGSNIIIGEKILASLPLQDMRTPEGLARRNLHALLTLEMDESVLPSLYPWKSPEATKSSILFLLAGVRQQVADCLLRKNLTNEAQIFLEDAVRVSPDDSAAALSLGAFRLRVMFFGENTSAPDLAKAAQIQLLKAAKLDSSKSSPFALLGYLYEYFGDEKRALGCYSKALLLDPWHPVAGRGLSRLKPRESLLPSLEKATESGFPLNGWAWRALGVHKAMVEGNDDLAVVSLLQALRSLDIQNPFSEALSTFFSSPFTAKEAGRQEFVETLADLASCYRRLGRFTASLRSYYAALEAAGEAATGALLNACANVEMELGLFDEASEKLDLAMKTEDSQVHSISAYGLSICLLSMAKRDAQDGKAGAAYGHLKRGIECCQELDSQSCCIQKLLGDLYSFGALLPPGVFCDDYVPNNDSMAREENMVRRQLSFVATGAKAYNAAEDAIHGSTPEETQVLRAYVVADGGSNLLLQAQILAFWQSKGVQLVSHESEKTYEQAQAEFLRALEINPLSPSAWCGLGCALQKLDPVLAQHAFCRSIELDHLFPEAYANLSFLYTSNGALDHSASVSDALTQVADTPMMWINRALILERQQEQQSTDAIEKAADAYRAALQVSPLPAAQNGLAMTCRMGAAVDKGRASCVESNCLLSEYLDATGSLDVPSRLFSGVSDLESGAIRFWSHSQRLIEFGRQQIAGGLQTLDAAGYHEGYLDVACFQSVQMPVESNNENSSTPMDEDSTILKKKLIFEPNRGDLWLAFAKVLVRHCSKDASALEAATRAVHKASSILMSQSIEPSLRFETSSYIHARDASDSLSLRYWMDRIGFEHRQSDANATVATWNPLSTIDLQRALILCPDNALAREAIKQV